VFDVAVLPVRFAGFNRSALTDTAAPAVADTELFDTTGSTVDDNDGEADDVDRTDSPPPFELADTVFDITDNVPDGESWDTEIPSK
jgi:hypothetical protein